MKLVLIDPDVRTVTPQRAELSRSGLTRLLGSRPSVAARFPNGDRLLSAKGESVGHGFSVGRSRVFVGVGIIVGKKDDAGAYTAPRTGVDTLLKLVSWVELDKLPDSERNDGRAILAVVVDPEGGLIEEVTLTADLAAIDGALGGKSRFMMKVTPTDAIFVKTTTNQRAGSWRKDGLVFPGRAVIIGCDRDGALLDTTAREDPLRASVEFRGPGASEWKPWSC